MKQFRFLALVFTTILLIATAAHAADRPNIVFIFSDDQRWDCLSIMGHPFLKTPNIDRIGAEGAVLTNAFVTTPLCSPSRASFLTGQYAHTHQVQGNRDASAVSHAMTTWPSLLQQAGYQTAWIGKIHMGNDASPRPGFDRWISFKGQGPYRDPVFNIDGKEVPTKGYMTDLLSDHAVEFVKKDHAGKPFALLVAHKAIHQPCDPAERHVSLYETEPLPRAPSLDDDLEGKPALKDRLNNRPRRPGGPGEKQVRNMLRCIQSIDDGVGKILKALEETNQLDNTVIIYSSDNGYFFGEHRLGDKRAAYEESIRVPMVIRYPKLIPAASRLSGIALNIDIAPTALELAGVAIPSTIHGKSLVPMLSRKSEKVRDDALFEYFMEPAFPHMPSWQSIRNDRWKYIHYTEVADADELYDLQSDPHEMKNLIADAGAKPQLDDLKSRLEKALEASK